MSSNVLFPGALPLASAGVGGFPGGNWGVSMGIPIFRHTYIIMCGSGVSPPFLSEGLSILTKVQHGATPDAVGHTWI